MSQSSSIERFSFASAAELADEAARRNLEIPVSDDVSVLAQPIALGRLTAPNRLACQPMEGCDGTADGSPGELTLRRYRRFGAGGAGLIWFEATAVVPEGRANPRQLWLHKGNVGAFARMLEQCLDAARQAGHPRPVCVLQLTHSGRYSRPGPRPTPIIAHHSAVLDPCHKLPADYPLISDAQLDELQGAFVEAAQLAAQAGFDAVDIKACHRYLISELLASFTRENSRYGGSLANRSRMLRETVARVRDAVGGRLEVMTRMNVHDAIAWPWGWGASEADPAGCDLSEPLEVAGQLAAEHLAAINVTVGNPYFNPHINRPADAMIAGMADPPEDPIVGLARILDVARRVQQALPQLPVVGSGYSWLRQLAPAVMAGAVRQGWASIVGLGRGAFAYPDFAADILRTGRLDARKVCVACSKCSQIMRDDGQAGCVVRDADIYGPIYRQGRARAGG